MSYLCKIFAAQKGNVAPTCWVPHWSNGGTQHPCKQYIYRYTVCRYLHIIINISYMHAYIRTYTYIHVYIYIYIHIGDAHFVVCPTRLFAWLFGVSFCHPKNASELPRPILLSSNVGLAMVVGQQWTVSLVTVWLLPHFLLGIFALNLKLERSFLGH